MNSINLNENLETQYHTVNSNKVTITLATLFASVYFLFVWKPPFLHSYNPPWFLVLSLAIITYLLLNKPIKWVRSTPFLSVFGLNFFGAIVSLFRAPEINLALQNTIAGGINFIIFLLFIPIIARQSFRKILIFILITSALLWSIEIQRLILSHDILFYSTFGETGSDKNAVGFLLALASIVLFYIAVFWKPLKRNRRLVKFIIRVTLVLFGIFFIYSLALIYARSAILIAISGICCIFVILIIKSRNLPLGILQSILFGSFIIVSVFYLLPRISEISPAWVYISDNFEEGGIIGSFPTRILLIKKGLFLISQNPIIGMGIGSSRAAVNTFDAQFPRYLIHNSYITDWVEKGILSVLSYIIWFFIYFRILKRLFFKVTLVDQIWLILFVPLFIEMNFLDMSTTSIIMLVILTGIYYEHFRILRST